MAEGTGEDSCHQGGETQSQVALPRSPLRPGVALMVASGLWQKQCDRATSSPPVLKEQVALL